MTTGHLRWADVDLGAIRANAARIVDHVPNGTKLFAVVKAGGYGHGARKVARAALDGGATRLAVATLPEAEELAGLVAPDHVLVMGGLTLAQAPAAAASGCSIAVSSLDLAKALAATEQTVPVHLKIDTGMGRFGAAPDEVAAIARFIDQSDGLLLAGTWTHFACADSDVAMTRRQFDRFTEALETLDVDPGLRHACNSAATHNFPEYALDGVRCGISLYGCEWTQMQPALSLRALVTHLKTVRPGDTVGYGATWRAREARRVATIAIGYADGVHRIRSNRGHVLVRGRKAPLIGTMSMDAITADVSDIDGVTAGDTATLIGVDGDERITAEEVAHWSGTISYEVLTSLGPRVERLYRNS
ncbi:MAG TPA: alanine racemase [Candidatus Dormibacteraeota bacterium]|nr:alanine racemase [Candidatus Dormibacteraeota bacterium]